MELKTLTALSGVSGDERAVRDAIRTAALRYARDVRVDRMGNLIVTKPGTTPGSPRIMLAAHMDEVGLMVRGIEDDGLLAYLPVGGIDPRVLISKRVYVGDRALPGVIASKAIHLLSAEERKKPLGHDALYVDLGTKTKEEAEKLVEIGDYIAFDPEYQTFGDRLVVSKALDDRVGCYNLLRLMAEDYPCDVCYVFNTQEETGLRGAMVSAFGTQTDAAIVLEGTTANDLGMVDSKDQVCVVGKGVAISFMDRTSIAHPGLNRALRDTATQNGIDWQIKRSVSGGNDAGAIQTARGPLPVCTISVPCRYIHSPSSVCSLADIDAQYALVRAFLRSGASFEREDGML